MLEPEPTYQRDVSGTNNFHAVEYLTPTDYTQVAPGLTEPIEWNFNPTPSVTFGFGNGGRAVPDLSTNADPQTGYLVYGASVGGLNEYGGTSFVDPQMNGSTAVIDSYLGHRVGFWNPAIYTPRPAASTRSPSSTRPAPATTTSTTPATPVRRTTRASASASRTWPSWPACSAHSSPSSP